MTELPLQEREPASIEDGRSAHRFVALWGGQVAGKIRAVPRDRVAQQAASIWQYCRSLTSQLRPAFSRWLGANGEASHPVNRYALHMVVILMAFGVVTVSRVRLPEINVQLPAPTSAPESESESTTTVSSRGSYRPVRNTTLLFQAPVPHTIVPERERVGIITYTVQANDTLWGIGEAFGLQVETIAWANPEVEADPDLLSVGQLLNILPVDGIYYTVKAGDTVEKLAKTYKTTVEKITGLELNGLVPPYTLTVGQKLILVDGTKPAPKPRTPYYVLQIVGTPPKGAPVGSGRFMWPVVGYWIRGFTSYHYGIDIANRTGTPIYAADDGYVALAGQDTWGYGLQVVLDHGNGYKTRYAHLSKILVKGGQIVKRGEKIALMGNTGRSTGPHLHFEIIKNGVRVDPVLYLPR
ncbi:MAG: peptidoglycan DD-metalloendopeptidase family protein [Anaerolineae bacterium]|nr:peptidoglycan DD-metalloendopeptidase family protein [Anaerolineae bacterium]